MPSENDARRAVEFADRKHDGTSQDGNAVCAHDITVLATIAAELARIADELHQLNRSLTITRCDGMEIIGLAQLIAETGNGRVVRR